MTAGVAVQGCRGWAAASGRSLPCLIPSALPPRPTAPLCSELCVLREDSASQQQELMRTLALLQGAHKREEDLRRQVCAYVCG